MRNAVNSSTRCSPGSERMSLRIRERWMAWLSRRASKIVSDMAVPALSWRRHRPRCHVRVMSVAGRRHRWLQRVGSDRATRQAFPEQTQQGFLQGVVAGKADAKPDEAHRERKEGAVSRANPTQAIEYGGNSDENHRVPEIDRERRVAEVLEPCRNAPRPAEFERRRTVDDEPGRHAPAPQAKQ